MVSVIWLNRLYVIDNHVSIWQISARSNKCDPGARPLFHLLKNTSPRGQTIDYDSRTKPNKYPVTDHIPFHVITTWPEYVQLLPTVHCTHEMNSHVQIFCRWCFKHACQLLLFSSACQRFTVYRLPLCIFHGYGMMKFNVDITFISLSDNACWFFNILFVPLLISWDHVDIDDVYLNRIRFMEKL